jgi:hypothetical protein
VLRVVFRVPTSQHTHHPHDGQDEEPDEQSDEEEGPEEGIAGVFDGHARKALVQIHDRLFFLIGPHLLERQNGVLVEKSRRTLFRSKK